LNFLIINNAASHTVRLENEMAKIAIIVEYDVPVERRAEFDRQLQKNVQETLQDEGCLRMEILRHASEPEHVVLNELWTDAASIEKHRQRPGHDDSHKAVDRLLRGKRVNRYILE
jgi:quinol monooxygenase YgiN